MNKLICIIPARGGSKRFPRKNLSTIGNKTLVRRSIDTALDTKIMDKILLTSDDDEILSQAQEFDNRVETQKRDESLSNDHTTIKDLTLSICKSLNSEYKYICIILPTAPFTLSKHISEAYGRFIKNSNLDGIVSLTKYEFPPQFSVSLSNDLIKPAFPNSPLLDGNTRSQNQEQLFRPNGAFYIYKIDYLFASRSFWNGKIMGYEMSKNYSVDIDTYEDYLYAQYINEKNKNSS